MERCEPRAHLCIDLHLSHLYTSLYIHRIRGNRNLNFEFRRALRVLQGFLSTHPRAHARGERTLMPDSRDASVLTR